MHSYISALNITSTRRLNALKLPQLDVTYRYVLNVLNNDSKLFEKASGALEHIKDEDELEVIYPNTY